MDCSNLTNKSPIHPPITLGSNSRFWELSCTRDQQILILFQELDPNLCAYKQPQRKINFFEIKYYFDQNNLQCHFRANKSFLFIRDAQYNLVEAKIIIINDQNQFN